MKKLALFLAMIVAPMMSVMAQAPQVKSANLSDKDLAQIEEILKGADASTYSVSIENSGKVTRLGSASIRNLSTVSAYHKVGGAANAANEIITTVGNYVKTVWTSKFASMYPEKVKAINTILEKSAKNTSVIAVRPNIKAANFTKDDFTKIQDILKDVDASAYNISIEESGKVTRLGSASIRNLSTVSAYHKVGAGVNANEIVTSVGNYIKTIWTSGFASKYPEKVKAINAIMEAAAKR